MRPRFVASIAGRVRHACGAAAAVAAPLLIACAKGTDSNGAIDEGGLIEDDAGRDVNVVPVPRDSSTVGPDGTVLPPDDSGGTCVKKVVINEIKTDGTTANDEMVELYNPSACDVPLGSWEIKYESGAGTGGSAGHKFAAGTTIASMGYLVLTPGAGSWTAGMSKTDGQIGLLDDTGTLVDGVAWGTVSGGGYREKTAATAPASGGSIGRSPNGADTDNNKTDFKPYASPSPGAPNP
jgi:hypothetical protein